MKKQKKPVQGVRLVLAVETIRVLTSEDLSVVAGGGGTFMSRQTSNPNPAC